jgi:formate-dependent nitrite reductase membrane component NrfD
MFSQNVIWYLFFAGAGSGLAVVVFVLDSWLRVFRPWLCLQYRSLVAPGLFLAIVLTVAGTVFLFFDLGRPDRILILITTFRLHALTIGAWSVLAFVILAGLQLLLRLRLAQNCSKVLQVIVRWATASCAASVMVYTGLLFQSLSALHFLASPLLPLLFVLSSLSCGVALLLFIGFLRQSDGISLRPFIRLANAHLPLLLLELAVIGGYLLFMMGSTQTASASAARLISGDYALVFWGGVVVLGLLVPLGLETLLRGRASWNSMALYAFACMAGALALRFCFLVVGEHPDMGLSSLML